MCAMRVLTNSFSGAWPNGRLSMVTGAFNRRFDFFSICQDEEDEEEAIQCKKIPGELICVLTFAFEMSTPVCSLGIETAL